MTDQPTTCDASPHPFGLGLGTQLIGPCVLRYGHDGPVHRDATGCRWAPTPEPEHIVSGAQPDNARTTPDNPAASDDGLREQYAAAIRAQCETGNVRYEALADAVLAIRDRRLLEIAAEADADSKQLAEVDERCDRYAAAIARVREVHVRVKNAHTDSCSHCSERDYPDYEVAWPCPTIAALDAPADPTPPDPLAQLATWLTANAAHHRTAVPLCRIPEAAQAHGGIAAGLDIAARVVAGLIAGKGLPVSGRPAVAKETASGHGETPGDGGDGR